MTPPLKRGGPWKWALGALALLAVIAVSVAVTVVYLHPSDNTRGPGEAKEETSGTATDIASANDTGPVGIITEDPTCAPWTPIVTSLATTGKNGWDKRDPSVPASAWTPEQKSQYQAVAQANRDAADQTVALVKLTPHRVMREIYEQFIAYSRAYADSIPTYTVGDESLNDVASTATSVVKNICGAITGGSAATRGPFVSPGPTPTHLVPPIDPTNPPQFMPSVDPICADWTKTGETFSADAAFIAWLKEDTTIPASSWSDQYKAENQAVTPVLNQMADAYRKLSTESSSPFVTDLGALAAIYLRAFIAAMPTYTGADGYLYNVFSRSGGLVKMGCTAAGPH